ncbi:hypothetical protein GGR54DRAFT_593393 [Hypoxylon sp. NC1633]|nr:hypothetical protein GGR54DRAFT_593393 [Hypoxylon sp. NC1633]
MADPERDPVNEDSQSSLDSHATVLFTPTGNCASSSESRGLAGVFTHEEFPALPAAITVPVTANSTDETFKAHSETTGSNDQDDDGQAHEPKPNSQDKGKAPVRVWEDLPVRTRANTAETSKTNLHSRTYDMNTTNKAEGLAEPRPSSSSSASLMDGIRPENNSQQPIGLTFVESNPAVLGGDERLKTTLLEPPPTSKHKQKQKQTRVQEAESEQDPGPSLAYSAPTANGPSRSEAPPFRPLQYGDPGWQRSADRPPKKLPIRFKDAVGRHYIFPWEKAKTWTGMERLIRSCFNHVDVIGRHVNQGHYDLLTYVPFSTGSGPGLASAEVSNPDETPTSITPADVGATEPQTASSSNVATAPQAPTPPPAAPSPPVQPPAVIILPELWEDFIEPGMVISMHMWPLDLLPHPPPPPPPPPLIHPHHPGGPHVVSVYPGGRGRGRGRGGGRGMIMPPRPGGWFGIEPSKPRGKTRKRQEGP